jgi:glycosyltransferase involved in cell wall biosynthesis
MTRQLNSITKQVALTIDHEDVHASSGIRKLLLVGPKPPPIGGSPLTVQAMLAEFKHYPNLEVTIINTSPALDVRRNMTGFNFEKVHRSLAILPAFLAKIPRQDAALVFSNDLFTITLAPILRWIAWIFRKPFFIKPVAASLDLFIGKLNPILRWYLLLFLKSCDSVLPQTQVLAGELVKLGCTNVHYLPGCRPFAQVTPIDTNGNGSFRLVYLGHITRRKGILVLLDAMIRLKADKKTKIVCDFYGPVHDEIREEFEKRLSMTPGARYRGLVEAGESIRMIAGYDALVLPTYYDTEGHPGVIIEAMQVGVPVISTQIRSLPELITDGENGILVPPQDSVALGDAIRKLADDPDLARKMGDRNRERGVDFTASKVTADLLSIVFPASSLNRQNFQKERLGLETQ